ncbi:HlyD family secretion protein [Chromatocurvus halotolerans]|uniref:HlyD family secretion protein n=1 Tax=Chromatocurvus halotolerans TaxID=1132028 RepID=A0A4R2KUU2_9GAMM|nr:efflux RND transporter periplasmic adaptor subunit [Chromatocurvus halotolerans]TCO78221.1 HlyD family secretion protein [Chromatocurvus halotolerans]
MTESRTSRRWLRIIGWVLVFLIVLACLGGLLLWLTRPGPTFLQGQIEADSVRVSAKIGGRVASIEVDEGDRVSEGDLLARLLMPEAEARAGQVEAQVDAAGARVDMARIGARDEQIRAARAQWQAAVSQADLAVETRIRIESLHADGVVPTQRRDEAVAQAKSAQSQADAAREAYEIARSAVRPQELRAAEAQLQQARSGLNEVQSALAEAQQFAPVAGEITTRVVEPGEVVGPGFPLLIITRTDRPWVTLSLREDLMPGIRPGRRFSGQLPALGMRSVEFEVHYIAPMADFATWRSSRDLGGFDLRTFEVRARPVEEVPDLRPGMSVLVDERNLKAEG